MKYNAYLLVFCMLLLSSCFKDKGNYDYADINDITIGDKGFAADTIYNVRANVDRLTITPELNFSLDPEEKGSYKYEWVAVGTQKYPGERFVLGNERNLDCIITLPAEAFTLYLKITDQNTNVVFSKSVELNVSTSYTKGWILACEDDAGNVRVDMLSISRDTLHLKNILTNSSNVPHKDINLIWVDNSPELYEEQVYVCTAHNTFRYGRDEFDQPTELTIFDPDQKGYRNSIVITDIQKLKDKRGMFLADGKAYVLSSSNEGEFGNPVSYYEEENGYRYFNIGDKIACNRSGEDISAAVIDQFILYNTDDKRFTYLRPLAKSMKDMADSDSDNTFSWNTKKDFAPDGLDFVTTINSLFGSGQSATLLKNPNDGKLYLYTYTITRTGGSATKGGKYMVSGATNIDQSELFSLTNRQGYLIYAAGNTLYGYNFRNGSAAVELRSFPGEKITAIFNDIISDQKDQDFFYVATYKEGQENGGTLRKYQVTDSADKIEITDQETWKDFSRIKNIAFKQF